MAFVKIADQTDALELVAFPAVYQEQRDLLQPGHCIAVKGKLNFRNEEPSILIDRVKSLQPVQSSIDSTPETSTVLSG